MRTTWRIIKKEKGTTQSEKLVPLISHLGKSISDQTIIANLLNKFSLSVSKLVVSNSNNHCNTTSALNNSIEFLTLQHDKPFSNIQWQYASANEVTKIIISLKSTKSAGYDEISNQLLKLSAPYIISPLTYICNAALNSGVFPGRLKYATVKPIHKKGTQQDLANYRPISLLTAFSKVFEELIYTRLHTHLFVNILTPQQFGFRAHYSTNHATFSLLNSILEATNLKHRIGGIFFDLHKAFDSVNHDIIFKKMKFYGIMGKFHMLLRSYLSNRYQKVIWNNNSSTWGRNSLRCSTGINFGSPPFLNLRK